MRANNIKNSQKTTRLDKTTTNEQNIQQKLIQK